MSGLFMIKIGYKLRLAEFALAIKLAEIPEGAADETKLTEAQTTALRGAAGALLLLKCTRVDMIADVEVLQQHVCSTRVAHIRMANAIARRAWQHSHFGLLFVKLDPPSRMLAVAGASHASSTSSCAVEGHMAIKMTDRASGLTSSG
eukprot:8085557-Pyramimonas_sp.AAC.1